MQKLKVGINGFGRIGRAFARIALERNSFDVVAINTRRTEPEMIAYLLEFDSVYGRLKNNIGFDESSLIFDGKKIELYNHDNPKDIPWEESEVDVVIDATGVFKTSESLKPHFRGNVKKVILTAPAKDEDIHQMVMGCSHESCLQDSIISNASCTTNCSAPMFQILHEAFEIESGFLTTAHAYTPSQSLLDNRNKTLTRSRAAAMSIIPTTTGAAKAVVKVIPELKGRIDAMALRVPVPAGSFVDITVQTKKSTSIEEINDLFKSKSENEFKGILKYETKPIVSSDVVGETYSSIFDSNYTQVLNGNFIKVFGWYDNEWGYSNRLVDMVEKLKF